MGDLHSSAPPAPEAALGVFACALPQAERLAALLAHEATVRGLIGPREVPRLWDRHLLNCAVLTDLIEPDSTVCDIGSGAGLPGLVIAIRRPDLLVTLVEPLLRRTTFLEHARERLGLRNVLVHRGRAEDMHDDAQWAEGFDVVTSRAVAPLRQLARWSLPLVRPGGRVLALKGATAPDELSAASAVIEQWGGVRPSVVTIGEEWLASPVTVVRIGTAPQRPASSVPTSPRRKSPGSRSTRRRQDDQRTPQD